MITFQHRESLMQKSHICALASQAGANLHFEAVFDYGRDGTFLRISKSPDGSLYEDGTTIDFQLKATMNAKISKDTVSFTLKPKDYNKLIERTKTGPPFMLILLALPKDEQEWASFSEDCTVLRKCCFWRYLNNEKRTKNSSTATIHFPRENLLTPDIIASELDRVAKMNTDMYDLFTQQFAKQPK